MAHFVLTTYTPDDEALQGIGVAAHVAASGSWYYVPYQIDAGIDADQWIIDNAAQIETDAPLADALIDPAIVTAYLEDLEQDTTAIIDGVSDLANLFPDPAQRKVLKAIILMIVDQFNTLRAEHSLAEITYQQAAQAIINKYKSL